MYRVLPVLALLLSLSPAARAQDQAPDAAGRGGADAMHTFLGLGPKPDAAAAALGRPLYGANCSVCHGADARGGNQGGGNQAGSNLLYSSAVISDAGGSNVAGIIRDGKGTMPGFAAKLSDAEIRQVAAYLDQLVEYVANRGTYTYQNILVGDAKAGQAAFARRCAACHSATGDLQAIAGRFGKPEQLQQAWLSPPRPARTVTVTQVSGPVVSGVLNARTDFEVRLTDRTGAVRTIALAPGDKVAVTDPLAAHDSLPGEISDREMHDITAYLERLK